MKIAHKIVISSSLVLVLAITVLSFVQYAEVKKTLLQQASSGINETSVALAQQITHFLNGKLAQVDLMAQMIDQDFKAETIQAVFDRPLLKKEFLLIFGGLESDIKTYSNDESWLRDIPNNWDARKRPWYPVAQSANNAVLTEPYIDTLSKELLISAVAKFTEHGQFKGAFGGDLSLKTVSDVLNSINFNGAGYAFLVTKSGNIVSHPNADLYGEAYSKVFAGQSPKLTSTLKELEVDNKTKLVAFTHLSGLTSVDWYIGVVVDKDVMMAPANTIALEALIGIIISLLLSLVIINLLMKRLLQPIHQLQTSLIEINGDFTKRVPITSNDEFAELGQQFNQFIALLQTLINSVKSLSQGMLESTDKTASGSAFASEHLQQQLQELDQLATVMTEMSSSAIEVANSAQTAAAAASTADKVTGDSVNLIASTTESMSSLVTNMDETVTTVVELSQFSNNIESILLVITSIAEQTNLLALNAAIEAARAGESGRGFAVVADEVRTLASRTQESTSEIKKMIEQLQSGVRNAEDKIKISRDSALTTSEQVSQTNDFLQTIRQSIVEINDMNLQIAAAAEQQSSTSEEINRNTTNIRDISKDLATGSCEQVELCENMVQQVSQQEQQLDQFKV